MRSSGGERELVGHTSHEGRQTCDSAMAARARERACDARHRSKFGVAHASAAAGCARDHKAERESRSCRVMRCFSHEDEDAAADDAADSNCARISSIWRGP